MSDKSRKRPQQMTPAEKRAVLEEMRKKSKPFFQKFEASLAETTKLFDPEDLVREASEILCVKDEVLGLVKFKPLNIVDFLEVSRAQSPIPRRERELEFVFRMMKPAYPKLTKEKLRSMHGAKTTRLIALLMTYMTNFLPRGTLQIFAAGSSAALEGKQLDS